MRGSLSHAPAAQETDFWRWGIDWGVLHVVYARGTQVSFLVALILFGLDRSTWATGLLTGAGLGLASFWTIEKGVRLLFNSASDGLWKLGIAAAFKMPFLFMAMAGVAYAGVQGWINVFAFVAGVLLVHAVLGITIIATAAKVADPFGDRYR